MTDTLFDPATTPLAIKPCAWCEGPIPETARRDSIYCSKSHRQAAHRFRNGYKPRKPVDEGEITVAYADPPYPGKADIYIDHPDFNGEVDHYELLAQLERDYPDGWALSTSSRALPTILRYDTCPTDVLVASWHRGVRPGRTVLPLQGWEPVIYRGGRQMVPEHGGNTERADTLEYVARARLTEAKRVTGAKPAPFLWWMFDLLGLLPGDTLADLFTGSGGVQRAWSIYTGGPPRPHATRRVLPAPHDA